MAAPMTAQDWVIVVTAIGLVIERIIARIQSSERNKNVVAKIENVEKVAIAKIDGTIAKIEGVAKVADATHTLVNSNMGVALRTGSAALRRVADLTRDEKDIALADAADKLLAEHEAKQNMVDRGETTPL